MAATSRPGPLGGKPALLALGLGLAAMLLASAAWRLTHPSLTVVNQRAAHEHGEAGEGGGAPGGMPGMQGMGDMGQLMQRAAANPRDVEALTGIAERFLMMNAPDKAMLFLDRALAERPADAHILDLKALALAGLGRGPEAVEYLNMALQGDPENAQVRFHLGMLFKYSLAKPDEAAAQFRKVRDAAGAPEELRQQAAAELETPAPAAPPAPAKP